VGKIKTIKDYEAEIKALHTQIKDYPDLESLQNQLYNRLSSWEKLIEKIVFKPGNEQHPWTEEEFNKGLESPKFQVRKMPTKKESHIAQTGDYYCYAKCGSRELIVPILIERKGGKDGKSGPHDIYGTLSNEKNRTNLYEEIQRFREDGRFEQMFLIAECSYEDFMKYVPAFKGKGRNVDHVAVSVGTRQATVAGLYLRGCTVIFAGTRARAVQMYKDLIRQWLMKNYATVLHIKEDVKEPDKLVGEDRETLTFVADGVRFRVPKEAVEVLQ
jgi:hypothetical protein